MQMTTYIILPKPSNKTCLLLLSGTEEKPTQPWLQGGEDAAIIPNVEQRLSRPPTDIYITRSWQE